MIEVSRLINLAKARYNEIRPDIINTQYLSFSMMVDGIDVFLMVTIDGENEEIVSVKTEGGYYMYQNENYEM